MRSLSQQLANYAAYHRDRRNIATHFVGIPMIVFAVCVLLSKPTLSLNFVSTGKMIGAGTWVLDLTPAIVVALVTSLYYLRLSLGFGVVMSALLALSVWGALPIAALSTPQWLAWGLGLFFVGWLIQFIGHWYEGRKPAFVDDLIGLVIGPLFVVAEFAFLLGLAGGLKREIEAQVGPTRGARPGAHPA